MTWDGWELALLATGGVVGAALVAWPVSMWIEVSRCEKPKYTVLRALGDSKTFWTRENVAELRKYEPYLVAEVDIEGAGMRQALSSGFRQLAGFIFGGNTAVGADKAEKVAMTSPVGLDMHAKASEKIAMTSPVAADVPSTGNSCTVSFMMPSKYTKDTLPKPDNANVRVREVPAQTLAALQWAGSASETVVEKKQRHLEELLQGSGLKATGPFKVWQYYPPFAPNWMRRNEVLVAVEE